MSEDSEYMVGEPTGSYNEQRDFTTLNCWKDARDVKLFFYEKILKHLPSEEKYNLDIQIRKSAISITANIAEGYGRFHYREGVQYYRISRGSLYELKDHLISCLDLNYIDKVMYQKGIGLIEAAKLTLNGFINYVKNKISKK